MMKKTMIANENQEWRDNEGELHRDDDLPAYINDSMQMWYYHGKLHRDNDKPAVIHDDKTQEWYQYGKRHRNNDQPAYIETIGEQIMLSWYQHGRNHRDDNNPAVIWPNGDKEFWQNGVLKNVKIPNKKYKLISTSDHAHNINICVTNEDNCVDMTIYDDASDHNPDICVNGVCKYAIFRGTIIAPKIIKVQKK